jgi:hypothetical protein
MQARRLRKRKKGNKCNKVLQPVQEGSETSNGKEKNPDTLEGPRKKSTSNHHKPMVSKNSKKVTPRSSERMRNEKNIKKPETHIQPVPLWS